MQKLFVKKFKDNTFSFFDDDVYHLLTVLRCKISDKIICVYEQKKYLAKIINLNPLLAEMVHEIPNITQTFEIDLFQAIIKPKSFELVFKKSIEMNTKNFYPIIFERSQGNLIKELRLNTLSKVCSAQSNRDELMNLHQPINFQELLTTLSTNNYDLIIVSYEKEEETFLTHFDFQSFEIKKVALITGPEGGFSISEINSLEQIQNVKLISLTKTILRSETATIYALAIINNYLLNKGN